MKGSWELFIKMTLQHFKNYLRINLLKSTHKIYRFWLLRCLRLKGIVPPLLEEIFQTANPHYNSRNEKEFK